MIIHTNLNEIGQIKNAVVTTGSFDGVHIGHQTLIKRLNELADSINGESVLITFYPHVRKVLYPETSGKELEMISSQTEKMELLERTGLDHLIIIHFTIEFAKTTAEQFVKEILVGKLKAKIVVVGFNHYFGHNKEGDYQHLKEWGLEFGFRVIEIPRQETDLEAVGSTRIRQSLKTGKIQTANAYLDHIYFIRTRFVAGNGELTEIGFLNYLICPEEDTKLIPPNGIYAIRVECNNFNCRGMLINNYHDEEAFSMLPLTLFLHIIDGSNSFKDQEGKVFIHKLISRFDNCQSFDNFKIKLNQVKSEIEELIY